ncbi:tetratricopeptide repeat protein [uncultured Fretibacterium sp.]|uniref:tetratricopeptide repeat protein n=1 Tax=uncultured Fretibacterium sp. TaxID=1678694 RepID=UPI0026245A0C|nr:tetratricopeptide repeat protein [uncultured Fretibacterium sp.]
MSGGGAARRQTRDRPRLRIIWAIYNSGEGVVQSYEKAAEWYRKAADQGYHWAQDNLGDLYRDGKGVPQSDLAAAEWYRKAADQGNKYSQLQMGNLLMNTWKDLKTAYKWYYLAYLNGHEDAQGKLNDIEGKGLIWNSAPKIPVADIESARAEAQEMYEKQKKRNFNP